MPRVDQEQKDISTQVVLSEAHPRSRSNDIFLIGLGEPGALLHVFYNIATPYALPLGVAVNANGVLLERSTFGGAHNALLLVRDAEVNDAYIDYGIHNRLAVNLALAVNANIIVRSAIAESAGLAGGMFDDFPPPGPIEGDEAEILPAAIEPPSPPAHPEGMRGWALVLTFRRWVVGLAVRWGRRR